MSEPEKIICKPTPWFLFRAAVMVVMFSVFAFLFYKDGSTGYRRANATLFLRMAFEQATGEYKAQAAKGPVSPEEWQAYTAGRTVSFAWGQETIGADSLPPEVQPGMAWPEPLRDAAKMKERNGDWSHMWEEYSRDWGKTHSWNMDSVPPHKAYDAATISQQWVVFYISSALALTALFFLVRTLGRSISADQEALYSQTGRRVPFADIKRLDLRNWQTKGLAFADYTSASGETGRVRIDGMTYGGFKKEQDEPAERLMRRIRSHFAGELIEYVPAEPAEVDTPPSDG